MKLVKPTKVASRTADELSIDQFLFPQAESQMGAAQTAVLRKADAAPGRKLGSFDLPNGVREHRAKAVTLFLGDGGMQILNLDQTLAHEDNESDVGFSGDPTAGARFRQIIRGGPDE